MMEALQRKVHSLVSELGGNLRGPLASSGKARVHAGEQAPHPIPKSSKNAFCPVTGLCCNDAAPGIVAAAYDLTNVRNAIREVMHDPSHDDGSYAPLLIRFTWHICGTYDKDSKT